MTAPAEPRLDLRELRQAFGCFMTGVTVVTTRDPAGVPLGFTANSFSSVSLEPPLLQVALSNRSANLARFATGPGFAVNILSEAQTAVSATFAGPVADRFAGVAWRAGPLGSPILEGVSAWFDCARDGAIACGDHTILVGRVGAFEASTRPGLGYYRGAYVTPAATAARMPAGPDVVISAVFEAPGAVLLVDESGRGLSVPMARVGRQGIQTALAELIEAFGVRAEPGQIYAVYEDLRLGSQHIALRCPTAACAPARGFFAELSKDGVAGVRDPAQRQMLERLAEETRIGHYGVYLGNETAGRVHYHRSGAAR